jgi:hypothetical protein
MTPLRLGRGLPERPGYRTVKRDAMAVEFVKEIPVEARFAALERRLAALEQQVRELLRPTECGSLGAPKN